MSCYIVQEIDGTSRFTLEDDSGFLLLEDCEPAAAAYPWTAGDITPPQVRPGTEAIMYRVQEDEDEFVLYLLDKL